MLKTLRKEACGSLAPGSWAPGRRVHYKKAFKKKKILLLLHGVSVVNRKQSSGWDRSLSAQTTPC